MTNLDEIDNKFGSLYYWVIRHQTIVEQVFFHNKSSSFHSNNNHYNNNKIMEFKIEKEMTKMLYCNIIALLSDGGMGGITHWHHEKWRKAVAAEAQKLRVRRRKIRVLKTHRFCPTCLLPVENVANFLDFLSFSFLSHFSPSSEFQGDVPLTGNFRGYISPRSSASGGARGGGTGGHVPPKISSEGDVPLKLRGGRKMGEKRKGKKI